MSSARLIVPPLQTPQKTNSKQMSRAACIFFGRWLTCADLRTRTTADRPAPVIAMFAGYWCGFRGGAEAGMFARVQPVRTALSPAAFRLSL